MKSDESKYVNIKNLQRVADITRATEVPATYHYILGVPKYTIRRFDIFFQTIREERG